MAMAQLRRSVAGAALALAALHCSAASYYLSQSGFSTGGAIAGHFEGADLNSDGVIDLLDGEVASFSLTFSGNSVVPAFSYGLPELQSFSYETGTSFIGDSGVPIVEGVLVGPFGVAGYTYNSGQLPVVGRGGVIFGPSGQIADATFQLLAVSQVPEPQSFVLLALGLVAIRCAVRLRGA
jgi:PEP-CTERM motif